MSCRCSVALCLLIAFAATLHAAELPTTEPVIEWDRLSLRCVQPGGCYARIIQRGSQLLCCYELHSFVWVRASLDRGRTWQEGVKVAGYDHGYAANPELLACAAGPMLLFFNGRPTDGQHPFAICEASSSDDGKTWRETRAPIFSSAPVVGAGCYEPAALQQPDGEVDLYFANEYPYAVLGRPIPFQEISLVRSSDNGKTWSKPETASYRPMGRDGMPVPLLLRSGEWIMAIEDNGVLDDQLLKPMVIGLRRSIEKGATAKVVASLLRWNPLRRALEHGVYGGAPYLRQFPGGTTVLSYQTGTPSGPQHAVVCLGDSSARDFAQQARPFLADDYSVWNSLFVRDASTVCLISTARIDGLSGVWTIDGKIKFDTLQPSQPSAAVNSP